MTLRKVLIANRGEIARRIARACHELGIAVAAVYSDVDEGAPWAREADEAWPLHGSAAADTYLNQDKLLAVAAACRADAVHPGYGFLSENADFAAACARHGLVFVGPTPEAMRALGSKAAARALAEAHHVPVVPGIDGLNKSDDELATAAATIGYPVLIKASAGGGGKGMRVVGGPEELRDALQAARREAQSAFGDPHVLLEKYFTRVHHVEVQVLGDAHGNLLHLYERECSIQTLRHQKMIEEAPSAVVSPAMREALGEAAVRVAKSVGYVNAGTVEFLMDADNNFYFIEMNTRLQVEHPVTEMITGIDLVQAQIRIAAGEPLALKQADVPLQGHAIEARLTAEIPEQDFAPSTGTIREWTPPGGPGTRVDSHLYSGYSVPPFYDSLLAKIIVHAPTRTEAIRRLERALRETRLIGVQSNREFLIHLSRMPEFEAAQFSTTFVRRALKSMADTPRVGGAL